jgi:hypothetical protein
LLGILNKNVKVAIFVEDAGIQQLILQVAAIAPSVCFNQIVVGICGLRILVQVFHVRVRGGAVEIEVVFLHVFPMISLAVRQTE